jgi:hypothetical protein
MQQNANLQEAIQLISNVLAQYRGTLQDHQAIQNAFKIVIQSANEAKVEIKADSIEEVSNS